MKYSAIQFLSAKDLGKTSQTFILAGPNIWLRKAIRDKVKDLFGEPKIVDGSDDPSIACDLLAAKPLIGPSRAHVRLINPDMKWVEKHAGSIVMPAEGVALVIEFEAKNPSKKLDKWKSHRSVHAIIADDPPPDTCKHIIGQLLSTDIKGSFNREKLITEFYETYKANFDQIENNIEKLKSNGTFNRNIIDEKDVSVYNIWKMVDLWIENKHSQALAELGKIQSSSLDPVFIQRNVVSHWRKYFTVAHLTTKPGDLRSRRMQSNIQGRPKEWIVQSYLRILQVDPIDPLYFERLIQSVCSTFIA